MFSNKNRCKPRLNANTRALADLLGKASKVGYWREYQVPHFSFDNIIFDLEENSVYKSRNSLNSWPTSTTFERSPTYLVELRGKTRYYNWFSEMNVVHCVEKLTTLGGKVIKPSILHRYSRRLIIPRFSSITSSENFGTKMSSLVILCSLDSPDKENTKWWVSSKLKERFTRKKSQDWPESEPSVRLTILTETNVFDVWKNNLWLLLGMKCQKTLLMLRSEANTCRSVSFFEGNITKKFRPKLQNNYFPKEVDF